MNEELNIKRITSLDLPGLQPYRTLRRPAEHLKEGIFVAEGEKVVRRLLASNLTVVSMLMTREWFEQLFKAHHSPTHNQPLDIPIKIFLAEKILLETIVGYNLHQGIMAVARVPKELPIEVLVGTLPAPHLLVALDGLVNSENVGVIVRNCAAFGVNAVLAGETSSSPYLRRAVRNSMGAIFEIPVAHPSSLVNALSFIRQECGTRIVAAHPRGESMIGTNDFSGNVCIVLGNEGEGISQKTLEVCTDRIAIPMMNGTDSLNVASASAVFLYEAARYRRPEPKTQAGRKRE